MCKQCSQQCCASQKNEKGGRPKTEYIIKLNTAKEMAMLERNEVGKNVRKYFIQVEEKYKENKINVRKGKFSDMAL